MKSKFDTLSQECSKLTTTSYSTSFSLGIHFLSKQIRNPIYAIYGFVRFADEIVDSFEGYDQKQLLQEFREDTWAAIENRISLNPILNAFQHAVHQYQLSSELIETFFTSMEMDLEKVHYSKEKYDTYIHGSAEVVGLMCLQVFTENDREKYEALKPFAMKLGSAFQKVNFLRDIREDFHTLGRIYFPNMVSGNFSTEEKKAVEEEIEMEFKEALIGIRQLPASAKGGVYLAYVYYYSLFKKIKKVPARKIMSSRIRISNWKKFLLMLNSSFQYKLKLV
jgi:15-cis-phytoene synthase